MGSLQIDLLGTSFAIQANEDDAYLRRLLKYYKQITGEIEKNGNLKTPLQVSILSGIMLCDELYKEKSRKQHTTENDAEAERLTAQMIERIENALA